jgi:GTP cyclohydrolase I
VQDISFYSYCGHHFAPFFGTAKVTYKPKKIITGLGKIVRLVREVHAKRLQIQEIMTRDSACDLLRVLDADAVSVETRAKHLCMCGRGPNDDNAETVVTYNIDAANTGLPEFKSK